MTNYQQTLVELMGRFGGYSHRAIASTAFDTPLDDVTTEQKALVASYLRYCGIRVTDWRDMKTKESKAYVRSVRPKGKGKKVA